MGTRSEKRITKTAVDALQPGMTIWDGEIKGLGCRCQTSGKFYFLKYRIPGGRQRWYTIGQHSPELTVDKARKKAQEIKGNVIGKGNDPSGDKQQKRYEKTIAELADRYLREHVQAHNKPSTIDQIKRIIEKRIKPELGQFKITEIGRADIKSWHQSMSITPTEANRALAYFSKMMSLAYKEWEFRLDNPCIGIKRFPEKARERFYSDDELQKIGTTLAKMEKEKSAPESFFLLVKLLATTGMRLGEALALKWEQVDLAERAIRLQDAKAGARTVPLGTAAIILLNGADRNGEYVIPGEDIKKPLNPSTAQRIWGNLRTKAKIPDARLHDLRHTAGTFAALAGANAFAVRDLLGHKTLAMTNRYVERAADMVRTTADTVSNRVANAMNGHKPAEVIEIKNIETRKQV